MIYDESTLEAKPEAYTDGGLDGLILLGASLVGIGLWVTLFGIAELIRSMLW